MREATQLRIWFTIDLDWKENLHSYCIFRNVFSVEEAVLYRNAVKGLLKDTNVYLNEFGLDMIDPNEDVSETDWPDKVVQQLESLGFDMTTLKDDHDKWVTWYSYEFDTDDMDEYIHQKRLRSLSR